MTKRRLDVPSHNLTTVLLGAVLLLSSATTSAQDAAEWRSVTMGRPGDRWLDTMRFARVARARRDKVYGYEVSFLVPGFENVTLFWSRGQIDLVSEAKRDTGEHAPGYRQLSMPLGKGRLLYPDTITAKSLPKVHRAILFIEADYTSQARGAIAAAEAFGTVANLGTMIPTARVPVLAPRPSVRTTVPQLPRAKPASKPTPSKPTSRSPRKPGCFVAGTLVHTPTGPVAIDGLRRGDIVLSRDSAMGETRHTRVVATYLRRDIPVLDVTIAGPVN